MYFRRVVKNLAIAFITYRFVKWRQNKKVKNFPPSDKLGTPRGEFLDVFSDLVVRASIAAFFGGVAFDEFRDAVRDVLATASPGLLIPGTSETSVDAILRA